MSSEQRPEHGAVVAELESQRAIADWSGAEWVTGLALVLAVSLSGSNWLSPALGEELPLHHGQNLQD